MKTMLHSYVIHAEPITTSKTLKTALNKTLYVPTYLSELTSKIQKFAKKLPMQFIPNVQLSQPGTRHFDEESQVIADLQRQSSPCNNARNPLMKQRKTANAGDAWTEVIRPMRKDIGQVISINASIILSTKRVRIRSRRSGLLNRKPHAKSHKGMLPDTQLL